MNTKRAKQTCLKKSREKELQDILYFYGHIAPGRI